MPKSLFTSVIVNKTKFDKKLASEIYDAISRYRAAYHATSCKIGWWWHSSSSNYNGWTKSAGVGTPTYGSEETVSGSGERYFRVPLQAGAAGYIQSAILSTIPGIATYPAIGTSAHRYLRIKYRSSRDFTLLVAWTTTASTSFDESKQQEFSVKASATWQYIEFDLADNAYWTGNLRQLRIGSKSSLAASLNLDIAFVTIDVTKYFESAVIDTTTEKQILDTVRDGIDALKGSANAWTAYIANKDKLTNLLFAETKTNMLNQEKIHKGWASNSESTCSCDGSCDSYSVGCECDTYACLCDGEEYAYCAQCDEACYGDSSEGCPPDEPDCASGCYAYASYCTNCYEVFSCPCQSPSCDGYDVGCDPYNYKCWTCDNYVL